jgi:hypothetical protein
MVFLLEAGTVGAVVSNIELAVFIIFACLSTFHPLVAKYFSTGPEEYSEAVSFSLEAPDMIEPGSEKQIESVPKASRTKSRKGGS